MWEEFEQRVNEIFRFINGKKVVLWGYERSGWFVEHLFKRCNRQIEYIIDNSNDLSYKLHIDRSIILESLDRDTTAVLLTFAEDINARNYLEKLGYREGINFIFVRKIFYHGKAERKLSYYDWLEYKYDADIIGAKHFDKIMRPNDDVRCYAAGIDYPLVEVLDNFSFNESDALFDFGCGKGNILSLCCRAGLYRMGGVEYDPELYQTACENFRKFGCDENDLIKRDAALVTEELDEYNYFFIQNSFGGETLDKVIKNIQKSYNRKKRRIIFICTGMNCHDSILKNSDFRLSKTIDTDYYFRYVHVYMMLI